MKWCFQHCWHSPNPGRDSGLPSKYLCILRKIERLSRILTDFLKELIVGDFEYCGSQTPLQVGSRYLAQAPTAFHAPTNHSVQMYLSLKTDYHHFVTWELVAGIWTLSRAGVPVLPETEFRPNSWFTRTCEASECKEDVCLALCWFLECKHADLGFATAKS